ncbi:MAG TPA: hypothetical protein VFK05_29690 [Polyangiaceae bacterium]|nr:hypothetical protein [Polyangiaceae bacterium]
MVLSLLVVVVVASRLPFLGAAYGKDPDASRVFIVARELVETKVYMPSRLPGYPVQEFFTALLVRGGPWAVNGMACFMGCVATAAFALWLRRLGLKSYWALALGFACVPVIYINSASNMDYVWALAFVMCAVLLATDGRPLASGICLGLAIGTRLSSGAMLLPLALLVAAKTPTWRQRARALLRLWPAALVVGALCYIPVFAKFGINILPEPGGKVAVNVAMLRGTIDVWGLLGCIALGWAAFAAILARGKTNNPLPRRERIWVSAACSAAVLLYAIAYAKMPLESGYLVPLVPFAIALPALWLPNWSSLVFAALLCLSPFVGSLHKGRLTRGAIFEDHAVREGQIRRVARILERARELPPESIVLTGSDLPSILATLPGDSPECVRFTSFVRSQDQYEHLMREGRIIYFLDRSTRHYQQRIYPIRSRSVWGHLLL